MSRSSITRKASRVRLILFDVDGVLTDGTILVHADGTESKRFHIRDGTAIVWAHRAGLMTGVLSARPSQATAQRAAQLAMRVIAQASKGKLAAFEEVLRDHRLAAEQVAYMGDDLLDLPVMARAGLSAAPADAVADVRRRVDLVTRAAGGHGAARELVEFVLRAQDRWRALVAEYGVSGR
jgi:3-deoxy-D-manno-octulosonate 8-phosphate phosphatase (KDO 8-P phosphatase)